VMDPDDAVEASLAAPARRELICVPGLPDPAAIEDHRLARLRVLTGGRRGTVATRYRTSERAGSSTAGTRQPRVLGSEAGLTWLGPEEISRL